MQKRRSPKAASRVFTHNTRATIRYSLRQTFQHNNGLMGKRPAARLKQAGTLEKQAGTLKKQAGTSEKQGGTSEKQDGLQIHLFRSTSATRRQPLRRT